MVRVPLGEQEKVFGGLRKKLLNGSKNEFCNFLYDFSYLTFICHMLNIFVKSKITYRFVIVIVNRLQKTYYYYISYFKYLLEAKSINQKKILLGNSEKGRK